jgi:ketosteroid isomerase-like protein
VDTLGTVRDVYGEWARGNYRAGLDLYDPQITLQVHNPIPDAGVYDGLEGLQRYMRRFLETWDDYEIRAVNVESDGDRVVVLVHHGGRASGAWVETEFFAVWTFSGDQVVRVDVAQDRDAAVSAAVARGH